MKNFALLNCIYCREYQYFGFPKIPFIAKKWYRETNGGNKMYSENTNGFGTEGHTAAETTSFGGKPSQSGGAPPRTGGTMSQDYIRYVLDTYSQTLIKLSYTYVRNVCDAEDIAQDVFVALLKRGKPFENTEHEKAWLLRTVINKSKNHLRSGWIKRTVSLNDDADSETDNSTDEKTQVMEAVLSLPEKYRTVIHLFYYNGYSINEIADIVGKKPATVGTLLARGRDLLKKMMIGGFDEDEQVDT